MSTPHAKPVCIHVVTVTVLAPFQCVFNGVTYGHGETVADVPNEVAEAWVAHGWASPASKERPAKAKAAKPSGRSSK